MTKIFKTLALALAVTTPLSFMGGISTVKAMESVIQFDLQSFDVNKLAKINWKQDIQNLNNIGAGELKKVYDQPGFKTGREQITKYATDAASKAKSGLELHKDYIKHVTNHLYIWLVGNKAVGRFDESQGMKDLIKGYLGSPLLGYTEEDVAAMYYFSYNNRYTTDKGIVQYPHYAAVCALIENSQIFGPNSPLLKVYLHPLEEKMNFPKQLKNLTMIGINHAVEALEDGSIVSKELEPYGPAMQKLIGLYSKPGDKPEDALKRIDVDNAAKTRNKYGAREALLKIGYFLGGQEKALEWVEKFGGVKLDPQKMKWQELENGVRKIRDDLLKNFAQAWEQNKEPFINAALDVLSDDKNYDGLKKELEKIKGGLMGIQPGNEALENVAAIIVENMEATGMGLAQLIQTALKGLIKK